MTCAPIVLNQAMTHVGQVIRFEANPHISWQWSKQREWAQMRWILNELDPFCSENPCWREK